MFTQTEKSAYWWSELRNGFVARTADFQELVHNIALQIAAAPEYVKSEDIPSEIIAKEKAFARRAR